MNAIVQESMPTKASVLCIIAVCVPMVLAAVESVASDVRAMNAYGIGGATAETLAGPVYAARLGSPRPGEWPGLRVDFPEPRDLSGVGLVRAVITNRCGTSIRIYCKIKADALQGNIPETSIKLAPYSSRTMSLQLFAERWIMDRDPALKALKRTPGVGKTASFDVTKTHGFVFYTELGVGNWDFGVLNMEFLPSAGADNVTMLKVDSFFPWVDGFGQGNFASWPEKIRSVEDLKAQKTRESAELDSMSAGIPDADRFGGWAAGPQLKASGHFRTEKIKGKWWLVDPDGHLFFSHGVGHFGFRQPTGITKRENYFESLPPEDGASREFWSLYTYPAFRSFYGKPENLPYKAFDFYGWNLFRKYGTDWKMCEVETAHRRARAWGLNTFSRGRPADSKCGNSGIPYTVSISTQTRPVAGAKGYWGSLTDFFSPEFAAKVKREVENVCKAGSDEYCLGWFSDNEQSWGFSASAIGRAVMASPDDQPAKIEFIRRLKGKDVDPADVPESEFAAFGAAMAEKYYSTVSAAIKEVAPGALYMGDRIAWAFPEVYRIASRYVDVLSVNIYDYTPSIDLPSGSDDKPLIVTEFHFGCYDAGYFYAGLIPVQNQMARADAYRRYVEAALDHPRYVGTHWFMWYDCPTSGATWGGNANAQCGLVSIADVPYSELVSAIRACACEMYTRRYK